MDANKKWSVLPVVREWSSLPFVIRRKVVSYLPIRDRVMLERVNSEFMKISNELFADQKAIGDVFRGYEENPCPIVRVIIRCPKLRYLSYLDDYEEYPEDKDYVMKLFTYCPVIKRITVYNNQQLVIAMAYFSSYRSSDAYIPGSFSINYLDDDDRSIHQLILCALDYQTKVIHLPKQLTYQNWASLYTSLAKTDVKCIESIIFHVYDYITYGNLYEDDPDSGDKMSDHIFVYNFIVSQVIRRSDQEDVDGDDPNAEYATNLKEIYGPINQSNFDTICKRCPNIATISIDEESKGINILNLLNCQKIVDLEIESFEDFDAEELDADNRNNMIEFLCRRGHVLQHLSLSIADPVDPLLDAITQHCSSIKYLRLKLQSKGALIQFIPKLRKLKKFEVHGVRLSDMDLDHIGNDFRKLKISRIESEHSEDAHIDNSTGMMETYSTPILMIGACLSILYNLWRRN